MNQKKLLTVDEIRTRLKLFNLQAVARETGLAPDTVYRLAKGDGAPSYDTLERVSRFLQGVIGG
jgi:DNA-binding phage protein